MDPKRREGFFLQWAGHLANIYLWLLLASLLGALRRLDAGTPTQGQPQLSHGT